MPHFKLNEMQKKRSGILGINILRSLETLVNHGQVSLGCLPQPLSTLFLDTWSLSPGNQVDPPGSSRGPFASTDCMANVGVCHIPGFYVG